MHSLGLLVINCYIYGGDCNERFLTWTWYYLFPLNVFVADWDHNKPSLLIMEHFYSIICHNKCLSTASHLYTLTLNRNGKSCYHSKDYDYCNHNLYSPIQQSLLATLIFKVTFFVNILNKVYQLRLVKLHIIWGLF